MNDTIVIPLTNAEKSPARRPPPAWPMRDMPRERLLNAGPAALSDTELVALVLGSGLPGHNVFDVARSLQERFGSLRAMLDATPEDFDGVRGVGPAKRAQLLAIMELARRSLAEKMRERPDRKSVV